MQTNEIKISYFRHPIYKDYAADEDGNLYSLKYGKIRKIKPSERKYGYMQFHICYNRQDKYYMVHRFIFECLNNRLIEKNKDIDHIDRNPRNNKISNLREVSRTTNNLNRYNNKEVEELPEDVIIIEKYNSHYFKNIYYSPSNNCLYRSSEGYKFTIPFKSRNQANVQDIDGYPLQIYLSKLRKNLGFKD